MIRIRPLPVLAILGGLALLAALVVERRETAALRAEMTDLRLTMLNGFESVAAGSTVVRTVPVDVVPPGFFDKLLKTEDFKRYEAEIRAHVSEEVARVLDEMDESPRRVTRVTAVERGDTLSFPFGAEIDNPRLALTVSAPDTYLLRLKEQRYSVTLVGTDSATLAELRNLTTGNRLTVTDFADRRVPEGWGRDWLRWSVGAAWVTSDSAERQGPTPTVELVPLRLSKGEAYFDVLALWANRWMVGVELRYGN